MHGLPWRGIVVNPLQVAKIAEQLVTFLVQLKSVLEASLPKWPGTEAPSLLNKGQLHLFFVIVVMMMQLPLCAQEVHKAIISLISSKFLLIWAKTLEMYQLNEIY